MQSVKMQARVGADGVLKLEVPLEFSNIDLEVLVIVHPVEKSEWPEGYFEQTYGSFADEPLTREAQGEYEERDDVI